MKILAATKQNYGRTIYIAELSSEELSAITTFKTYEKIPVIDSKALPQSRERDDLLSGDVIDPGVTSETMNSIRTLLDERESIVKAAISLRGSLTKMQSCLNPATK